MTDFSENGADRLESALCKVASELTQATAAVRQELERVWGRIPEKDADEQERPPS